MLKCFSGKGHVRHNFDWEKPRSSSDWGPCIYKGEPVKFHFGAKRKNKKDSQYIIFFYFYHQHAICIWSDEKINISLQIRNPSIGFLWQDQHFVEWRDCEI